MQAVRALLIPLLLLCCASAHAHDVPYQQPYPPPYQQPYPPAYQQPTVIVQQPTPYYVQPAPYYARPPRTSIVGFGFRGVVSGALAGLGASYFITSSGGDTGRGIGLGVASGALAGAGLGLSLGMLDRLDFHSAYYISRDLSYGVLFGATVGALGGTIAALAGGDEEAILIGAAAGSLSGVVLGLLTGIVEGQYRQRHREAYYGARQVSVSVASLAPETNTWGARLAGRF